MMVAIAIDFPCRTTGCDDIGVTYLFCSYKARADQSASSLFAALLKQLVHREWLRRSFEGWVGYLERMRCLP
jgi:hypothetical protein